jgi:hypothetical protein
MVSPPSPTGKPTATKVQAAPKEDLYPSVLEKDFPRILASVQAMWGYQELNLYFKNLTLDNRGDREGFPKEAWEEIFMLLYLHQAIVPGTL